MAMALCVCIKTHGFKRSEESLTIAKSKFGAELALKHAIG